LHYYNARNILPRILKKREDTLRIKIDNTLNGVSPNRKIKRLRVEEFVNLLILRDKNTRRKNLSPSMNFLQNGIFSRKRIVKLCVV